MALEHEMHGPAGAFCEMCLWITLPLHVTSSLSLPSPPLPLPPREALSSVQGSMASMVSHSSIQAAGMQQLQERLGQAQAGPYGGGAGRRV